MESKGNPSFSFIVPVYNVEQYLRKCLDSILQQTFGDFEVILVDDGSTDNSYSICKDYASQNEKIKCFSKLNEGQGVARNFGLGVATGKYVIFVDSDDWIEPNLCAETIEVLERTGANFINFGFDFINEQGKKIKEVKIFEHECLLGKEIFSKASLDDQIYSVPWNKVYRLDHLMEFGIKFPHLRAYEDLYFSRCTAFYSARTAFISRVYYHALARAGSTTRKMSKKNIEMACALINLEKEQIYARQKGLSLLFEAHVLKFLSSILILVSFRIDDESDYLDCFELIRSSGFYQYANKNEVLSKLKLRNRLVVKICNYPRILRSMSKIAKIFGVTPY